METKVYSNDLRGCYMKTLHYGTEPAWGEGGGGAGRGGALSPDANRSAECCSLRREGYQTDGDGHGPTNIKETVKTRQPLSSLMGWGWGGAAPFVSVTNQCSASTRSPAVGELLQTDRMGSW